jgi:hypothetical protein
MDRRAVKMAQKRRINRGKSRSDSDTIRQDEALCTLLGAVPNAVSLHNIVRAHGFRKLCFRVSVYIPDVMICHASGARLWLEEAQALSFKDEVHIFSLFSQFYASC